MPTTARGLALVIAFALAAAGLTSWASAFGVLAAAPVPGPLTAQDFTAIWGHFHYLDSIAYASSNDSLYVTNVWGKVSIINGRTNAVVGELGPFVQPYSAVYDPEADELFVGTMGNAIAYSSYNMSIIDVRTNRVVGAIPGTDPWGTVYDASGHHVYIESNGSVLALDAKTNAVERSIPGFIDFRPQAYDPARHLLFGVNDTDILAVNLTTDAVAWKTGNPGTGLYPVGYNPLGGDVYLVRQRTSTIDVDVVEGATGRTVATITNVFNPQGFLFDPANGDMYISNNAAYWELVVVNGTTNLEVSRIRLSAPPGGLAYDPANHNVYVACTYPTANFTGVVLVVPSATYPLPTPPLDPFALIGWMTVVGAIVIASVVLFERRRHHARPPEAPSTPRPPDEPEGGR